MIVSKTTARRFVLGRQGLWPGRRWAGPAGTVEALRAAEAAQSDPLNVVARSHDIALWGRVLDYRPEYLDRAVYRERAFFDYGGSLFVYPRLDRAAATLVINGFWLEEGAPAGDPAFGAALARGLARFAAFLDARRIDLSAITPPDLRAQAQDTLSATLDVQARG